MPLQVALIADDLSGALDAAAPFAQRGFRTLLAPGPEHLAACLAGAAEVVAVSTASRHCAAAAAAERAGRVTAQLAAAQPRLVFKKVDSRLKGNVASECAAVLAACGRLRMIVAPAVPALGRVVTDGAIGGAGIDAAIDIRAAMATAGASVAVPDAVDDAALERIAAGCIEQAASVLPVGTRGLAGAVARALRPQRPQPAAKPPAGRMIFAIGSRDPITGAQVEHLRQTCPALPVVQAPDGELAPGTGTPDHADSAVLLCTASGAVHAPDAVAGRFAGGVAQRLRRSGIATVFASGGDTAAALAAALGVWRIELHGELFPGVPWGVAERPGDTPLTLITKSGGFGGPAALSAVYERVAGGRVHA